MTLGLTSAREATQTPYSRYSTWSDYAGSADSMQYSSLTQITKANVSQLELAWFYPVPDRKGNFGFNPLVVGDVMYLLGRNNAIVAVEAATGKEIWSHPVDGGSPGNRGINYWESRDRSDRRLIFAAAGALQELDARTGASITTFGDNGRVNMRAGTHRPLGAPSGTPGRVFENLFITGSNTGELYGSPPGDVRAYDVITGALVWTFHTIPHPGEFGADTWPEGAWKWAGGANVWGEISIDGVRGIAFVPIGSPTHDSYGGDRKGANLFGNSLVALDARTGKRLWHFQVVHHDLWDYDLTTAPKLLTIRRDGKPIDVVAQPTKLGFLYLFDRVTGAPIWPIEERPVPASDVPGEAAWPTQPFPSNPPPYSRQTFTPSDINPHLDAAEREQIRDRMTRARNDGLFTPQTLGREQISIPGEFGGSNWGGSAADPTTGMLYVRASDQPAIHRLRLPGDPAYEEGGTPAQRGRGTFQRLCESCHGQADPQGIRSMDRSTMINVKAIGPDKIRQTVRSGQNQMPAFQPATLSDRQLDNLTAYLFDPAAGASTAPGGPAPLPSIDGMTRYFGPLGTLFRASNGLPAISPPWAQLVAYDLNQGRIAWRAPLGNVRALAAKGITGTGSPERIHRNGPVVTAGGLIFVGTWGDGTLRAFDRDTGTVLWTRELDANPEGIAAVFESGGRQFVAFCAAAAGQPSPGNIAFVPGKPEAQGYYVFSLPRRTGQRVSGREGGSKWAYFDRDQRLRYATDGRGNRIMDFSHAGYQGGGVSLPALNVVNTLAPEAGDNLARIQAALDEIARRVPDSSGTRGALLLRAGRFEVSGPLKMAASGVVLRGSGSGDAGTVLVVTGSPHRCIEIGGTGSWQRIGTRARITDAYVPSGASAFSIDNASAFRVGDSILVDRAVTEDWIRLMGMDRLSRDGKPQVWIAPGTLLTTDRRIAAIAGNRVTLDVPLSDAIDSTYSGPTGASIEKYTFPGRIENVGVESLRVRVPPRDVPISDAQYTFLRMSAVSDAWARDLVIEDTQNTITLGSTARRVTLDNVHIRHAVPFSGAASPADIAISGMQILVHRSSVSGQGVWPIVTQAGVTGPNAIVNFSADQAGVAPHQRWATGLLVDSSVFRNGTERRPNIAFSNREYAGSGHGWSVGWAVAWNVTADYVLIQQPPGAKNWCIGCIGRPPTILWHGNPIPVPEIPSETFESPGVRVTPASLYLQQLRDRLGDAAVRRIME